MQNEHPALPNLEDPRYLDEIGWLVCHQKHVHEGTDISYEEQRVANSKIQLEDFGWSTLLPASREPTSFYFILFISAETAKKGSI